MNSFSFSRSHDEYVILGMVRSYAMLLTSANENHVSRRNNAVGKGSGLTFLFSCFSRELSLE